MHPCFKLLAAALLAAPFAALDIGVAVAQTANPEAAKSADAFCDYCKDYTDAATSAGSQRSSYRPGVGYAAEPQETATTENPQRPRETGLQLARQPSRTETK